MAAIAKLGTPSISTAVPTPAQSLSGLLANDTIAAGDACYINADGMVYRANGAAATAPAQVAGFAATAAVAGQAVSIYWHVNFNYGSALTPGALVYLSGTVLGGLDSAASTGGVTAIGQCVDATRIWIRKSF